MSHFDPELIEKRLQELGETVSRLRRHQSVSVRSFRKDSDLQWVVEHGLQLAIQQVIDIASHLLVASGFNNVSDYGEVIQKLVKHKVIPEVFGRKIIPMINFRNILVHEYAVVDVEIVHIILRKNLDDFDLFANFVKKFLKKRRGG